MAVIAVANHPAARQPHIHRPSPADDDPVRPAAVQLNRRHPSPSSSLGTRRSAPRPVTPPTLPDFNRPAADRIETLRHRVAPGTGPLPRPAQARLRSPAGLVRHLAGSSPGALDRASRERHGLDDPVGPAPDQGSFPETQESQQFICPDHQSNRIKCFGSSCSQSIPTTTWARPDGAIRICAGRRPQKKLATSPTVAGVGARRSPWTAR